MLSDRVLQAAELRARRLGISLARRLAVAFCGLLALAFLTAAAWLLLDRAYGPIVACAALGLLYAVIALAVLILAPRAPLPPPDIRVGLEDLVHTFVMASEVGRSARRR